MNTRNIGFIMPILSMLVLSFSLSHRAEATVMSVLCDKGNLIGVSIPTVFCQAVWRPSSVDVDVITLGAKATRLADGITASGTRLSVIFESTPTGTVGPLFIGCNGRPGNVTMKADGQRYRLDDGFPPILRIVGLTQSDQITGFVGANVPGEFVVCFPFL